jgi:MYXO-CTERM domain-containing protein
MFKHTRLASLVAIVAPALAHASHIDLMTDGIFSVAGTSIVVEGSPDAILGGARRVGTPFTNATLSRSAGDDFIAYRNTSGLSAAATLEYGDFEGGNGELNADLAGAWNSIEVDVRRVAGLGQLRVDFEAGGEAASASSIAINQAGLYYVEFNQSGLRAIDFSDIDRITIRLLGANGSEFDIGPITFSTVPAPSVAALAGIGALASLRRRR